MHPDDTRATADEAPATQDQPLGTGERAVPGRPLPWEVVALTVSVAAAGFGAQAFMWSVGSWPPLLTGWPDYRAATVGDLVMVPTLTGALLASLLSLSAPREASRLPFVLGSIGLLLGAATQAGWLLDDAPQLNWSMERPHHFTYPGWYHAGFLVAVTTLTGYLLGCLVPRVRTADRLPNDRLLACAAVGFASLLGSDLVFPAGLEGQHVALGGVASVTATLTVTAAALVAIRPRGPGRDLGAYIRRCATGAALALSVAALSIPWPSTRPTTAIAAVVAVTAASLCRSRSARRGKCVKTGLN
ncbi:hypothetical protein AB0N42_20465 [Streptomyces pseudogriseolus]|uniref:hypothetical protein n=1 Tax=Streptomyces pseudogriseolus TaxID=36817 RepID=UPI0034825940